MKKNLLFIGMVFIVGMVAAQSWTMQSVGFQMDGSDPFKVSIVDANVAWTIGDYQFGALTDREFSKTVNGGATWTAGVVSTNPNYDNVSVAGIDANTAFVDEYDSSTNYGGYIYKTTDGGATWNEVGAGQIFTNTYSYCEGIYFWNAAYGVAFGDPVSTSFEMFTTADSGNTWTAVPSANIPATLTAEYGDPKSYMVIDSTIWIATSAGRVFKSTDMGIHWSVYNVVTPSSVNYTTLSFLSDKMTGIAITYNDTTYAVNYYSTTDGGATWSPLYPSGDAYFYVVAIPGTHIFVSADAYVDGVAGSSYSLDYGNTWISIDTAGAGTTNGYIWLTFYDINTGYASGFTQNSTTDGIYKWVPGALFVNEVSPKSGIVLYPNPLTSASILQLTSSVNNAEVVIYDMVGKEAMRKNFSGDRIEIEKGCLEKGIYFVRVRDEEKQWVEKMVVE